jgi:hypothetical protein
MAGEFTCHKPNGTSTVDYVIASPCVFPTIVDFTVDNFDPTLSDVHNPICLTLNFVKYDKCTTNNTDTNNVRNNDNESEDCIGLDHIALRTIWKHELTNEYKSNFDNDTINDLHNRIDNIYVDNLEQCTLDKITEHLCNILIDPAKKSGISKEIKNNEKNLKKNNTKSKNVNKPWFCYQCETKRTEYSRVKKQLKKTNTEEAKIQQKK